MISSERVRQPISDMELERRWTLVRNAMAKAGIDCLVLQNSNQFLGGYVRYFTDIPAENGYPQTVIFPSNDQMTVIASGPRVRRGIVDREVNRGVKDRITLPYFLSLRYTNSFDAEAVVDILKARGDKRIGVVGPGLMSAVFYNHIVENLPGVEVLDATDLVDQIKAIKSPEELELVRKAAKMHDAAWECIPALIRPGKKEYEIRSALQHLLVDMGSEEQLIVIGYAQPNQPAGHKPSFFQNRTLQAGDQLMVMLECSGPGGFYCELARTICLGDPPKALLNIWDTAVEAQKLTALLLRPGARPAEIFKVHNEFIISRGYQPETRLYSHGQGYDLVERPAIREDETMLLKANMNIAIHPQLMTANAYAFCCDNYIVGEAGAERISKMPMEVLVI